MCSIANICINVIYCKIINMLYLSNIILMDPLSNKVKGNSKLTDVICILIINCKIQDQYTSNNFRINPA